jgi:ADP-heptose:LPS heptosyltransferase
MSVLVLRALGIGDLATAVPALRALRAAYPTERLSLAAPAWLTPLAELIGAVDRMVPAAGLAALPRNTPPPSVAVNLHGRGPQSHRLLAGLHPQRLLAFHHPEFPSGPQWIEQEHEVLRWCRLLDWYGIPAYPGDLSLHPPAASAAVPGATIVHAGSTSALRRWPPRRFAEVARRLDADGHTVVLTGAAGERDLGLAIAREAGLPVDRVLAGRTDLAAVAALVSAARLVVTGDTGVGHLATGYGVPSVVLFGPVPPSRWGPPLDRPQHRALYHRDAQGSPLLAIGVAEVLTAVVDVLAAQGNPHRATPGERRPVTPGR